MEAVPHRLATLRAIVLVTKAVRPGPVKQRRPVRMSKRDPAPGSPELDLSLPDGTVEIFVCDSLGQLLSGKQLRVPKLAMVSPRRALSQLV